MVIKIILITFLFTIVFFSFKNKWFLKENLLLLSWLIGPIWFIWLVKNPTALPRYLLIGLPSFILLISNLIDYLYEKLVSWKHKVLAKLIAYFPFILSAFWIIVIIKYYQYLSSYSFPYGMLSPNSDIPVSYVYSSINTIFTDANINNIDNFTISNNLNNATVYDLNAATRYTLDHVYHDQYIDEKIANTHYIMAYKPISDKYLKPLAQFGPYVIIKLDNNVK